MLFPSTFFPIAILQNAPKNREMEIQPVTTMSPLQNIFKIREQLSPFRLQVSTIHHRFTKIRMKDFIFGHYFLKAFHILSCQTDLWIASFLDKKRRQEWRDAASPIVWTVTDCNATCFARDYVALENFISPHGCQVIDSESSTNARRRYESTQPGDSLAQWDNDKTKLVQHLIKAPGFFPTMIDFYVLGNFQVCLTWFFFLFSYKTKMEAIFFCCLNDEKLNLFLSPAPLRLRWGKQRRETKTTQYYLLKLNSWDSPVALLFVQDKILDG